MNQVDIIVIGSSNTDMIIKVPVLPQPGETVLGGSFAQAAGGKGANQAVAAARTGGKVLFLACVGDDTLGEVAISGYQKDGIDTRFIQKISQVPTGVALITVDDSGENTIAVASGANAHLTKDHVADIKDELLNSHVLLMQLESPLEVIQYAASLAAERSSLITILNPAPAQALPDALFPLIDILTPNQTEAELLTGIPVSDVASAKAAGNYLLDKGVKEVIITMGSQGAVWINKEQTELIEGFPVKAVDTTAAGDTFNGALSSRLAAGDQLPDAIKVANAAGALSVTQLGAQPSIPEINDVLSWLENQK